MTKYKKFVNFFFFTVCILLAFHFIMWSVYTSKINLLNNYIVGDLARSSYYVDLFFPREKSIDLEKKHTSFNSFKNDEKIDLITIGDSFSNGAAYGKNPYFQDYIATKYNLKVLNILQLPQTKNYIESVFLLLNSGTLAKLNTKYVLIEVVQRDAIDKLSININKNINSVQDITNKINETYDIYNPKEKDIKRISYINNLNFNAFLYNFKFYINGYGKYNSYYIEDLNKNLFTSKNKSEILFYHNDINHLEKENIEAITKINSSLNELAKKLKEQNIKLYFMLAVDKYNLYRKYIVSNNYPESNFFEYFRTLPKEYEFIDTKKILSKELSKGTKDIFYSDDTHWSYKASEAIVNTIKFDDN